jgi:hypothetical protein
MILLNPTNRPAAAQRPRAFSLFEVMIALAIFFVGSFAILQLISSSLNNVRRLQRPLVDAGPVLAIFAATNRLVEGNNYHGNLGDDSMLGKAYRDYNWVAVVEEIRSNKLFRVECVVRSANGGHGVISDMTTILYKPNSPSGSLDGGIGLPGK